MMTLRRIAMLIASIVLFSATSASASCWTDDGDDDSAAPGEQSSPPDDDSSATDDDASGDDADDDSVDDDLDDDLDDDADDDSDDDSDDDTTDDDVDDDAFADCEGDNYGSDDCANWMHELYCGFEYPVILGDTLYTQGEAVDGCRGSSDPRWHAVRHCMSVVNPEYGRDNFCDFVACMSATGTPGENREIFDATQNWRLRGFQPATLFLASLNYWCVHSDDPYQRLEYWGIWGAILHPETPALRAGFGYVMAVGPYPAGIFLDGDSVLVQDFLVSFWMGGWIVTDDPEAPSPMEWVEYRIDLQRAGPP